ncbi:unnamed protein product [Medioppia subpectinata]|uniref:Calcium uniporter protein n=1 Tax=Medioppia subpectinata TaxID=1979941 RepID=A0A7R9KDM6_9ACAR|nr:unnamed protein product [Medioppia subpectinata]CAG2101330.1 unnamed protein product [Medioppia subpectinata]
MLSKRVFQSLFVKHNQYFIKTQTITKLNKIEIRRFCDVSTDSIDNKILFQFKNGFFNFDLNQNHYIISYWTPLRTLIQTMDYTTEVPKQMTKVVDESQKVAYSATTPVGFVFSNLTNLSFKHPTLGLCQIYLDGTNDELIHWKDKLESELQYGSDSSHPREKSLEDHELSFLEHQKNSMKLVFNPLLKEYQSMISLARTDANRKFKWGGLFLLSAQLGFVARLTWFEYSWDIMEPITWMLTYAMMVGTFAYYIVTSQEYLVPSVERRLTINKFWKLAQKQNFDVTQFRALRQQIKQLDEKILRLKTLN